MMAATKINPKLQLNLGEPSLTILHIAGIAGLWMTLKQLEIIHPNSKNRAGNLTGSLTPGSVTLDWEGQDLEVLDWLFKQSFQINDEGLISLSGLAPQTMDLPAQVAIHKGITATFLQHNKSFKSAGITSTSLTVDGVEIKVKYKKAALYNHQNFANQLCNKQGELLKNSIGIVSWLYPGTIVTHEAFNKQTKFEETPQKALALLFAPVACQYFVLRSSFETKKRQYALVIPEVNDLEFYAKLRWSQRNLGYKNFYCSSLGEAGLKLLTYETSLEQTKCNNLRRCQVISFGTVSWSPQQKTRTHIIEVEANEETILNYKLSSNYFPDNKVIIHKKGNFITSSLVRELIADNLVLGLPWWANFWDKVNNDKLLKQLSYEKDGVYNMLQHTECNEQAQKLFVQACHEALRKTYAKIYENAKDNEYAQIGRKNQRLIAELRHCNNAEQFRRFLANFWSKAGQISILQDHWEELLPITTGTTDWKLARDLTLLAIASYKKVDKPPSKTSGNSQNNETEMDSQIELSEEFNELN